MSNNEASDEEKASFLANQFQNVFTTESSLRQTYKATLKGHSLIPSTSTHIFLFCIFLHRSVCVAFQCGLVGLSQGTFGCEHILKLIG